jgi:hypothetical protein
MRHRRAAPRGKLSAVNRRVFNVLTAVSLVMCVTTVALWVRSYWIADYFYWFELPPSQPKCLESNLGKLGIYSSLSALPGDARMGFFHRTSVPAATHFGATVQTFAGFGKMDISGSLAFLPFSLPPTHGIIMPHFAMAGLFGVMPAIWCWRCAIRQHRGRLGLCPRCGYDLRATPERCPECGSAVGPVA